MIYPLISEYTEAITSAEDNFNELAHLRPVLDEYGHPIMSSGNFAVVYKMVDPNTGKHVAVKCFTRDQANRCESYKEISDYISKINNSYGHNYLISAQYLENELYVDSSQTNEEEFPILLMDWVDGFGLEEYIRNNIDNEEKLILLYERFEKFVNWLLPSHFSHGDLKPDNIIIDSNDEIVLIDYDGMFVPTMSGQISTELGTPQFQYQNRKDTDFNEYIDDYASIYLLLILKFITVERQQFSFYSRMDKEDFVAYSSKFINDSSTAKLFSAYLLINSVGFIERESLNNILFDENKRNRNLELRLISEALEGDTKSMIQLGDTYSSGIFTPKDPYKAFEWYSMAKLAGDINASCGMCRHFYHLKNDYFGIRNFCINPIHKSLCNNSVDFALCREAEENICRNELYAHKYFEKAAALGFAPAMYWLSFDNGRINVSILKRSADQGYIRSCIKLAEYYKNGSSVPINLELSLKYYQKAANLGNDEAQYFIGLAYLNGEGNYIRSLTQAIIWLTKASEQKNYKAIYQLSRCYFSKHDYEKAFQVLSSTENSKNAKCLHLLAYSYEVGLGTKPDLRKACELYREAIKISKGSSKSEIRLDRIIHKYNIVDETFVLPSELEKMEESTGVYSKDGSRFLLYRGAYIKEYCVSEGTQVLCDNSFNDLYSECDGHYLEKLILPKSLKRIGNNVFCASIKEIVCNSDYFIVRDGFLLSVDEKILYRYFGNKDTVNIPSSVIYIKGGAFSEKNLKEIIIPSSVKYINDNPFVGTGYFNKNNKTLLIRNYSKYFEIKDKILYDKYNKILVSYWGDETELIISKGVKEIGKNAFWESKIRSISLYGSDIEIIHESAFDHCFELEQIIVGPNEELKFKKILPFCVQNLIVELPF